MHNSIYRSCTYRYAIPSALLCILGFFANMASANAGAELNALMQQYAAESANLSSERRTAFFTFWEKEFRAGLAATTESSEARFRMLDELGAIQRELGKPKAAAATYARMIDEARKSDVPESLVVALDNAFHIAKAESDGKAQAIGEEYIAAAALRAGETEDAAVTEEYANALVNVALYLNKSAANRSAGDRQKSLNRAIDLLKAAIALPKEGSTPTPTKLYWLADAYSAAGDKSSAAATYGRIAAMDQTNISRLWMRQLQVEQLHRPGTPGYCRAIEEVLDEFERSGRVDEHELTLRHLLGKSYRQCGEFAKSAAILSALVGQSGDVHMNAYNLLLTADSQLQSGHFDAAEDLFQQVLAKYPASGSAPLAEAGLMRVRSRRASHVPARGTENAALTKVDRTLKWPVLIANLGVICGVLAFVVYRRAGRRSGR